MAMLALCTGVEIKSKVHLKLFINIFQVHVMVTVTITAGLTTDDELEDHNA